jgi:hypothetical protein
VGAELGEEGRQLVGVEGARLVCVKVTEDLRDKKGE